MNERGTGNNEQLSPIYKRYSLLELPDDGERWPHDFDAITIEQREGRPFKAREARRMLDYFFEVPALRHPKYLYGVLQHFYDNEYQALAMIDTNAAYRSATFMASTIIGNSSYGYKSCGEIELLKDDLCYNIYANDLLTYFKIPVDFSPVSGEILGMMISALRDEIVSQ